MPVTPDRFDVVEEQTTARIESAKPVLAFFIERSGDIVESRLQKLLFYADAVHYDQHGTRLTDVRWQPYMYGMYADEIATALSEMQHTVVASRHTVRNGDRTVAYTGITDRLALPNETRKFLAEIHRETTDISTSQLAQWTKDHELFQTTDYDSVADFSTIN